MFNPHGGSELTLLPSEGVSHSEGANPNKGANINESGSRAFPFRGLVRQHAPLGPSIARGMDTLWIGLSLFALNFASNVRWSDDLSLLLACTAGLFLFFAQSNDLYRSWRGAPLRQEVLQITLTWLTTACGVVLLDFSVLKIPDLYRAPILAWLVVAPSVLVFWRVTTHGILGYLRSQGLNSRRVAIVGAREMSVKLANTVIQTPSMGLTLLGFFDDRQPAGSRPLATKPQQVIGNLAQLVRLAKEGRIDVVYITLPLRAEQRIQQLVSELSDTTASVYIIPDLFLSSLMNTTWSNVGDLPVISIHETPFYGVDGWIKRLEDITLSLAILTVIALPMLLIALGVRLSSPGPIIFKQRRYGLQGQEIVVWKFRSMTVCEDEDVVQQATRNDQRITPFGQFLRRTSLDELPQFYNVLQGRMSIVGPRPHAVAHNELYRTLINGYMLRHKVKPGITGWAQVNGLRGETETIEKMRQRVEYDLEYIRRWSLSFDLKIIAKTVLGGFTGKNAY